jgi:hypothetical protein
MSYITRSLAIGGATVASLFAAEYYLEKQFPPTGSSLNYNFGDKVTVENPSTKEKVEKTVIGYFGADKSVFDKGIHKNYLYYGTKKTAQHFSSGGKSGIPQVGVVVANREDEYGDHGMTEYLEGGYKPLNKRFMHEAEVEIYAVEAVTSENRIGFYGSLGRMLQQIDTGQPIIN